MAEEYLPQPDNQPVASPKRWTVGRYLLKWAILLSAAAVVGGIVFRWLDQYQVRLERNVAAELARHYVQVHYWRGRVVQATLSGYPLSAEVVDLLAQLPSLERLVLLDVPGNAELAGLSRLRSLRELVVINTPVGQSGAEYLADCQHLSYLRVSRADIDDQALAALCRIHSLAKLDVSDNLITDNGLLAAAQLPNLKELSLRGNPITDKGVQALQLAAPQLTIHFQEVQ